MPVIYKRIDLEEMLEVSHADFKTWEKTRKVACLRDASNKLVAVAENLTANKIGKDIKNWGEFKHTFLKEFKDEELFGNLYELHRFFYEGLSYDQSFKDIEYKYNKTRKALRTLLKHTEVKEVTVA